MRALNDLVWELRHRDPQRGLTLAEEACAIATEAQDTPGYCDSLCGKAQIMTRMARFDESMALALEALALAEDDSPQQANAFNIMGVSHMRLGNYADGMEVLLKGLKIAEALENPHLISQARNGIGCIYFYTEDYKQAHEFFIRDLTYTEVTRPGDSTLALLLSNIATCDIKLGHYDAALQYEQRALSHSQTQGMTRAEAFIHQRIAEIYILQGDFDQATDWLSTALEKAEEVSARDLSTKIHLSSGEIALKREQFTHALAHFDTALKIATEVAAPPLLIDCHEKMAAAFKQMGMFEQALHHYEQYTTYRDTLHDVQLDSRVKSLQTLHELESARKEAEIYQLKAETLELEMQKRAADEAERLRHRQLHAALEKEHELSDMRTRLMTTISHEFRTPLTIIQNAAYMLERNLDKLSAEKRQHYTTNMRDQVQRLHQMLNDLSLVLQHTYGQIQIDIRPINLPVLLKDCVHQLRWDNEAATRVQLELPSSMPAVPLDSDLVTRIVTELLTNALRYTAGQVFLSLAYSGDTVTIRVQDSGPGISAPELPRIMEPFYRCKTSENIPGAGLGLTVVQDCVKLHNGTLRLNSTPEKGTTVTVQLPVNEHQSAADPD